MVRFIMILVSAGILSLGIFPAAASAAKPFVKKGTTVTKTVRTAGFSIPVSVKFRPDKLGVLFSFRNFSGLDSVSYAFTYTANGITQGAGGTIRNDSNPQMERELLFGTCSTSVCTYHSNITNARLTFTAKRTNGQTVTKNYSIRPKR